LASHLEADCPLRLVASTGTTNTGAFYRSPHGTSRFGNLVFVLRGQTLTTYSVNDLGDITTNQPRQDFIGTLGSRETEGGVLFNNGFLYVSSDAGLEIFDLRNVRPGGTGGPLLVSRTAGLHYRRLAISGTTLAALFPATDLPCAVGGPTANCFTTVDLFNVANPNAPIRITSISSQGNSFGGFNDVAFNYGFLVITANNGTVVFLVSNGSTLLSIGNDSAILTLTVSPGGTLGQTFLHTLATLRLEHANPIRFHRQGTFDEAGVRLITLVDELDPQTLQPARTFAFDVFDFMVPMFEGKDPRIYEQVSYTQSDEVKYNPMAAGPYVYVVGEVSGLQEYGTCGLMTGRIEWDGTAALVCPLRANDPSVAEIHGWVTGMNRLSNVELFLDGGSLGTDPDLAGPARIDVPSTTPVQAWRVNATLASSLLGDHVLRAVGTDINGNRRQFASQRVYFPKNWQQSCVSRRRAVR
jgi:hypothetical protein